MDIGEWALYGSKADDRCVIPSGTVLQPGEGYQVATGDPQPRGILGFGKARYYPKNPA